jgi:hypothetical protein
MAFLTDLPTELLRLILAAVANINLIHVFASRRTCRAFHAVITNMLTKTPSKLGLPIHTFLNTYFLPVFDSLATGPSNQGCGTHPAAPFSAMPWAISPSTRAPWLREEASWRSLALASPSRNLIQRLQLVSADQKFSPDPIDYLTGGYVG